MTMHDVAIADQIKAAAGDLSKFATVYAEQLQSLNQSYIQSSVQAIRQEDHEELGNILKNYRRLRKVIASLSKAETENFFYQAGTFIGAYRVFLDFQEISMTQAYHQEQKSLLDGKHVKDILLYLYQNPYARHKNIAAENNIQPNYLSEILNKLLQAGYVERYGKNKATQYNLTGLGRQICRTNYALKRTESVIVETEYRELQDKERFLQIRASKAVKGVLKKEDGYAKRKRNYETNLPAWAD